MSGTSLDGLDIVYSNFTIDRDKNWKYKLHFSQTVNYPDNLQSQLRNSTNLYGLELMKLNNSLGQFIGEQVDQFLVHHQIDKDQIDLIGSHGHTVFHQPELNLTTQIGSGAVIAATTGIKTVCDFRSGDVALNGQGAPLVPIGDSLLFNDYDYLLNLGGIANVTDLKTNPVLAYDISFCNLVLNYLSNKLGKAYDEDGNIGRTGQINNTLLESLNQLSYYHTSPPKSLGIEWIEQHIFPILENDNSSVEDKMATSVEHIACQIGQCCRGTNKRLFVSGGGANNQFLLERMKHHIEAEIFLPENEIIEFKEALIFAFLGVLRTRNEINCLKSVTGASIDNIGGAIYQSF